MFFVTDFPHDGAANDAVASFADLRISPAVMQALERMEISIPTPIQAKALPALLEGRDVIGQARTGSGKTLAFGIPAVDNVDPRLRGIQVLVLTPTRELANQVADVLKELSAAKGVTVATIYGGVGIGPQRTKLKRGVQIVVGTPGRVLDLLNQGAMWLDKVRFLVLDEADEMLDRGFAPDVERILSRATPDRQTALFSATVPDWVRQTADKHLDRPLIVAVDPNPEDAAPIEHVAYDVPAGEKLSALKDLLDHRGEGSIIVFGRTKHGVKKLAKQLEVAGYPVAALQGNLSQNARDRVMADFRSGEAPILLATNVAARGLDVSHVQQVINVELPESPELLTHRIGRTGRMGRRGQAITLLGPEDGPKWRQLERGLGRRIARTSWRGAAEAINADVDEIAANAAHEPAPRGGTARPWPVAARSNSARFAPSGAISAGSSRTRARRGAESVRPASPRNAPRWPRPDEGRDGVASDTQPFQAAAAVDQAGRRMDRPARIGTPGERSFDRAPRPASAGQLHAVTCDDCGQPAQVPFRPDPTRPVYCGDCFRGRRGAADRRRARPALAQA